MSEVMETGNRIEQERRYDLLKQEYEEVLRLVGDKIADILDHAGLHPSIKSRIKSFNSLFKKRIRLSQAALKSGTPITTPVTDLLGFRIICPFLGDRMKIERELLRSFEIVEVERKGSERSFREFGYESVHLLIRIPDPILHDRRQIDTGLCEIQIRTILQDAWAEVEHELVYKADFSPFDEPMKRKLAALSANLTLSDIIFQELRDYQHLLTNELAKRRTNFYKKIEMSIDDPLFKLPNQQARSEDLSIASSDMSASIDDMLLEALNAHNRGDFTTAIGVYTRILRLETKEDISALIHTHRGMAYFSESRYDEAIQDFSRTLELDPKCHKAAYFRGVVRSVLEQYAQAIEDFDKALEVNPYHFYSLYRRSQAYFHVGDYPKSMADCLAAEALDPANGQTGRLKELVLAKLRM
ncbi:MAG: tetratricopeptide repeat protein [Spirochaetes bacterium]|nr:tetratricopeptide repeat protein [Spirochaetota bacterium]